MDGKSSSPQTQTVSTRHTDCCIVGGGPAGMVLGYILAREGIEVTVLESHPDFNRSFRGDTVHPSTLELFEQLGFVDRVLELPHTKMARFGIETSEGKFFLADFADLHTRFPYIALIDQSKLLALLADEASSFPNFHLTMNANVKELVEVDGEVVGVRYLSRDGVHELRAQLVVAADGRHSILRKKSGLVPIPTSAPMDVLWFHLPKSADDQAFGEGLIRVRNGHLTVTLDRDDHWQVALVIPKGGYHQLKQQGLDDFRQAVLDTSPHFADRIDSVSSWNQIAVLDVESSRLPQWYRPGLLFIGDAAHTMSPVGGVGINYAIQDAIAAANVLTDPLLNGVVKEEHLRKVQKLREPSVRVAQAMQSFIQQKIIGKALANTPDFRPPFPTRFRFFRKLAARFIGYGLHQTKLSTPSVQNRDLAPV